MTKADMKIIHIFVLMRDYISQHYGDDEARDPCYDIRAMAEYVAKNI